jgi:phosphoribosyl 1,2-cyclic phosphodiesterase
MLQVTVLGSGSRGNAILVDGSEGAVLIDCGFGTRTMAQRLATAQRRPSDVQAVVLTHEHTDHACGVRAASERWDWPVYATARTHAALAREAVGAPPLVQTLGDALTEVAGFRLTHHAVPHDAADCRAFVITDVRSGARAGVVLDCGHAPDTLPAFLARCDLLVMESNHCPTLLVNGPYPWMLKERIRGGSGHLSNAQAGDLLAACVHQGLRGVMLAHLSETNNTPEVALASATQALRRAGWNRDGVWAAPQRIPHAPVQATGGIGDVASVRLALGM